MTWAPIYVGLVPTELPPGPAPMEPAAQPLLVSLQLHQEARTALTQASSSVQAATVTVMGARTLLADLEGT